MFTKKPNNFLAKGIPAKLLLIPGTIIFLFLLMTFGSRYLPNKSEYKKDQAHLLTTMEGRLAETPKPEVKLPVKGYIVPGAAGTCMVDAGAGVANFLEPDIDFDKYILLGNPTLIMAAGNKSERYGPGANFLTPFINLGYTPFRGATTSIHPPQNAANNIEPQNFIYFKTKEEELAFIKRLLSSNIIPIATLTRDPFEPIEGGLFSSLVGYDRNGIWLNVSGPLTEKYAQGRNFTDLPIRYDPRFLSYEEFFRFWTPDHQFFWVIKTGSRLSDSQIYAVNKKNAQQAPENLQKTITFLKKNGNLMLFTAASDAPTAVVLHRFFQKQGNLALAEEYLQMAKTYTDILATADLKENRETIIKTLEVVYPYFVKVSTLWP